MSEVSEAGGRRARRCGENRPGRRPVGDFRSTGAPGALQLRSPRSFRKKLQNTQPKRTKYSPKTNLLIQRKHRYAYDMPFLCPHHPWLSTHAEFLIPKRFFLANFTFTWKLPYNRDLVWKLISLHQKSLKYGFHYRRDSISKSKFSFFSTFLLI